MAERIRAWGVVGTVARGAAVAVVVFAFLYVLVIANPPPEVGGSWRTTNTGSALDDPSSFLETILDGLTFAGLLFIVASGFSLIFGLMRVVNMAYGAFYLLGGYIAYEVQQRMTGSGIFLSGQDVNTWEWVVPWLVAMACIAVFGLAVQQLLLRWNQGQDLRQALITIAVSVIVADQVIAHFPRTVPLGTQKYGGNAVTISWPGWTNRLVDLHIGGVHYSLARLVMLGLGVSVGVVLWLWLQKTRTGMVIRAGVDDRQMTSAIGINIQWTFAIAFLVGSALAAFGAVVSGSQSSVAQGQDGQWLLYALVVVIIGGMGSLAGAAVGAVLYGLVFSFAVAYLPITGNDCCQQYSVVLTFALMALVLAFRPAGTVREGRVSLERTKVATERLIGIAGLVVAILAPAIFSTFWLNSILTQALILGIGAASLIFLSAYGGMISLAQTGLMGIAGYALANMVTQRVPGGETKGLLLGWDPTLGLVAAILLTVAIGVVFGAVASRSYGIYFLMLTLTYTVIAFLFVGSVTLIGGFSPVAGVDQYTPGFIGNIVEDRQRLYYIALISAVFVYLLIRYVVRTPFGISFQGIRDEPTRMASLGYNVALHRTLAFGIGAFVAAIGGVLYAWWFGQLSPTTMGLDATIQLLVIAVIGGLRRIEGAWIGAIAFLAINNEITNRIPSSGLPVIGGTFNTVIGFIFLAIVIVSPDGLMGLWDRIWDAARRRGGPPREVEGGEATVGATSS